MKASLQTSGISSQSSYQPNVSASNSTLRSLKGSLTLPLSSSSPNTSTVGSTVGNLHIRGLTPLAQLNSPDLRNLGLSTGITPYLTSPDFEKLISSGLNVGLTPTSISGPTGNAPQTPTTFLNPKFVSEEQEQFAQHFEEKLKRMIKREQDENVHQPPVSISQLQMSSNGPIITDMSYMHGNSGQMSLPIVAISQNASTGEYFQTAVAPMHHVSGGHGNLRHDLTTSSVSLPTASVAPHQLSSSICSITSLGSQQTSNNYFLSDSGSVESTQTGHNDMEIDSDLKLSAADRINLTDQEAMKLERKRQRNRDAARKCRERKMERINFLEERVTELKTQNGRLQKTAAELREQLKTLQHVILEHTKSGCSVKDAIRAAGIQI